MLLAWAVRKEPVNKCSNNISINDFSLHFLCFQLLEEAEASCITPVFY